MTTLLPAPSSSRLIPEHPRSSLRHDPELRREHLRLKNNPLQTTSDMTRTTNPSPSQSGGSHE
jgi:hypothetical protein